MACIYAAFLNSCALVLFLGSLVPEAVPEPDLAGIGVLLGSRDGDMTIRKVLAGGAATRDGRLRVDDVITAVAEGKNGPFVDLNGKKIGEAVELIRGPEGSTVRLKIRRPGTDEPFTISLARAKIPLPE